MSSATPAVAVVDSATTEVKEFNSWDEKGNPIRVEPTKQDSAPAKEAVADPAPPEEKTADTASESATEKEQKPHLKTKEDTDKRFKELLDELKAIRKENEELRKPRETRDTKQASQPAPEPKSLKEFLKDWFAKNPGKEYEDGIEAWDKDRETVRASQMEQSIRQRIAIENAQKDLQTKLDEARQRYPDFEEKIKPATQAITDDPQIPAAVKAVINDSPVLPDLMYVLADPESLRDLIHTAKTNPAAAIRKIVLTEQLVQAELSKGKEAGKETGKETARDDKGKFVASDEKKEATPEPKPRAPKPPSEVGGRGTASEDALVNAAKSGSFKAFEDEQWRRVKASRG